VPVSGTRLAVGLKPTMPHSAAGSGMSRRCRTQCTESLASAIETAARMTSRRVYASPHDPGVQRRAVVRLMPSREREFRHVCSADHDESGGLETRDCVGPGLPLPSLSRASRERSVTAMSNRSLTDMESLHSGQAGACCRMRRRLSRASACSPYTLRKCVSLAGGRGNSCQAVSYEFGTRDAQGGKVIGSARGASGWVDHGTSAGDFSSCNCNRAPGENILCVAVREAPRVRMHIAYWLRRNASR